MAALLAETLRRAVLMRSLVEKATELSPGEDNFERALDFAHVNLKHHRFSDSEAEGDAVRRVYEGLCERLEQHSEHRKAQVLRALCSRLCKPNGNSSVSDSGSPSSSDSFSGRFLWEWGGAHTGVENGVQALALLYWLSNASAMIRSPTTWVSELPDSLTQRPACERVSEEVAAEAVDWDFLEAETAADEEDPIVFDAYEELDDEDDDDPLDLEDQERALSCVGPEAASGSCSSADDSARHETTSTLPGSPGTARAVHVGRPPAGVDFCLIQQRRACPAVSRAQEYDPRWRVGPAGAENGRQQRLLHLRLLRECLRVLASVPGTEWQIATCRELEVSPVGSLADDLGYRRRTSEEAAFDRRDGSSAGVSRKMRVAGVRLSPTGEASLASTLLPSALWPLTQRLQLAASRAATLHAFATALLSGPGTPSSLQGLGECLLEELASMRSELWRVDSTASLAQTFAAAAPHSPPRGHCGRGIVQPTFLALEEQLRSRGWLRKLHILERLHRVLCAHPQLLALGGGVLAHGGRDGGEPDPLPGVSTFGGTASTAGTTGLTAVSYALESLFDSCSQCELIEDLVGDEALLRFRLLCSVLLPYLRRLQPWVQFGLVEQLGTEVPVTADPSIGLGDQDYWASAFTLDEKAIPRQLRHLGPAIGLAGKSRHLLSRLPLPPAPSPSLQLPTLSRGHAQPRPTSQPLRPLSNPSAPSPSASGGSSPRRPYPRFPASSVPLHPRSRAPASSQEDPFIPKEDPSTEDLTPPAPVGVPSSPSSPSRCPVASMAPSAPRSPPHSPSPPPPHPLRLICSPLTSLPLRHIRTKCSGFVIVSWLAIPSGQVWRSRLRSSSARSFSVC